MYHSVNSMCRLSRHVYKHALVCDLKFVWRIRSTRHRFRVTIGGRCIAGILGNYTVDATMDENKYQTRRYMSGILLARLNKWDHETNGESY